MSKRAMITLTNDVVCNFTADSMTINFDTVLYVYDGDKLVGMFDIERVASAYISTPKGGTD